MSTTPSIPAGGAARFVGAPVHRREDKRLLTGHGQYVDDIVLPGMLHAAFVRSSIARATITSIDTSAALALPGVVAVITGQDDLPQLPSYFPGMDDAALPNQFPLAVDDVRFVGDPVAIVIAESRYLAEDGCDLVDVEYEPLDVVVDYDAAFAADSPLVHAELESNVVSVTQGPPDPELDAVFEQADHVIKETIRTGRCTPVPMETRGIIASWDSGSGELTVHVAGQGPHFARGYFAGALGIPEHLVRVIQRDVGGGFGLKMFQGRDELCVLVASMRVGRPVKWIEDREENLTASSHSRQEHMTIEAAVSAEGDIQATRISLVVDAGAYPTMPAHMNSGLVLGWFTGPYKIGKLGVHATQSYTNTCGLGPYRGPWAIETTAREIMVDVIARRLGLDPADVRRRNVIQPGDLPYAMPTGIVFENISPSQTLDQALETIGYEAFREKQAKAREEGRYLGIGMALYIEPTAFGGGQPLGIEAATLRIEPSGAVTVLMGFGSHGQSIETTMAQVVADRLGVPMDSVVIVQGDTASAPVGAGNGGSRSAVVGGAVAGMAAEKVKAKVLAIAGHLMEVAPEDLELADGIVAVKGSPGTSMTLAEVAGVAYAQAMRLPEGMEPGLEDTARYSAPFATHSNAAHVCTCEVDVNTGMVTLLDYAVSEDCGVMINPKVVDGQVIGGAVQGIGMALLEEIHYDEFGNPMAANFKDYLMPTADMIPTFHITHIETPSNTPGGHKGAGEGGAIGAVAAVANAVSDALAPFGVSAVEVPLGPSRVLDLIDAAQATA